MGGFAVAEKLRENAEYDFMEGFQYDDDRKIVQDFAARRFSINAPCNAGVVIET